MGDFAFTCLQGTLLFFVGYGSFMMVLYGWKEDEMEHKHRTPDEWSFGTRSALRRALTAEDQGTVVFAQPSFKISSRSLSIQKNDGSCRDLRNNDKF